MSVKSRERRREQRARELTDTPRVIDDFRRPPDQWEIVVAFVAPCGCWQEVIVEHPHPPERKCVAKAISTAVDDLDVLLMLHDLGCDDDGEPDVPFSIHTTVRRHGEDARAVPCLPVDGPDRRSA